MFNYRANKANDHEILAFLKKYIYENATIDFFLINVNEFKLSKFKCEQVSTKSAG